MKIRVLSFLASLLWASLAIAAPVQPIFGFDPTNQQVTISYLPGMPAIIGLYNPATGTFTGGSSASTISGDLSVTSISGATPETLFSTAGYGNPNTAQGFFTSGQTSPVARIFSNGYAQTALYGATTRDSTQFEIGEQITWTSATGYAAFPGGVGNKPAVQISVFSQPGGGKTWGQAISNTFALGWHGGSGNFGIGQEIDPINYDVDATGSPTTISGLWINPQDSHFPITSYMDMSSPGATTFGAHYGLRINGATAVKDYSIYDTSSSFASYNDIGTHTTGISLGGTYSSFQIAGAGWGISAAGGGAFAVVQSTGKVSAGAATTANASLNLAPGVAPTAPNNGDAWTTAAGLFTRIGGVTGLQAASTNLAVSQTAPTVASGFCTTPVIVANGTWAFDLNVGTACAGSVGALTMPAATTGWVCDAHDVTTPASNYMEMTGGTATTVTFQNYSRTLGTALNFTSSDHFRIKCTAY